MTHPTYVVGAGLAGLMAAHAWPQAIVLEAAPRPAATHRALLRFRSDAVARLTGVRFTPVRVHKGIWFDGAYHEPSIQLANLYARKVTGRLQGDRSIWSLAPVDRWIAPEDFYDQLVQSVGPRIQWGCEFDWHAPRPVGSAVVSTAPLPYTAGALGLLGAEPAGRLQFQRAAIRVERFKVPGARAYQTVYFPQESTQLYRASITGDVLIMEYADEFLEQAPSADGAMGLVREAFGLGWTAVEMIETVSQKFGKISPIDDTARRALLFNLTHKHNVYSLGRFATWRNILLDDVVQDIDVIKRLLRADSYELSRAA